MESIRSTPWYLLLRFITIPHNYYPKWSLPDIRNLRHSLFANASYFRFSRSLPPAVIRARNANLNQNNLALSWIMISRRLEILLGFLGIIPSTCMSAFSLTIAPSTEWSYMCGNASVPYLLHSLSTNIAPLHCGFACCHGRAFRCQVVFCFGSQTAIRHAVILALNVLWSYR